MADGVPQHVEDREVPFTALVPLSALDTAGRLVYFGHGLFGEKQAAGWGGLEVVEDAVSGVQAGHAGDFALVIGVDRGGNAEALADNGADVVVEDLAEVVVG